MKIVVCMWNSLTANHQSFVSLAVFILVGVLLFKIVFPMTGKILQKITTAATVWITSRLGINDYSPHLSCPYVNDIHAYTVAYGNWRAVYEHWNSMYVKAVMTEGDLVLERTKNMFCSKHREMLRALNIDGKEFSELERQYKDIINILVDRVKTRIRPDIRRNGFYAKSDDNRKPDNWPDFKAGLITSMILTGAEAISDHYPTGATISRNDIRAADESLLDTLRQDIDFWLEYARQQSCYWHTVLSENYAEYARLHKKCFGTNPAESLSSVFVH